MCAVEVSGTLENAARVDRKSAAHRRHYFRGVLTTEMSVCNSVIHSRLLTAVADPEFHNGGRTVEEEGFGEGAVPPSQKNLNFYLKMVGFGAF